MNEEYNLANLKDQFTLNHLKKMYHAQKDEVLDARIVIRVLSKKESVILQKKNYLLFKLSDDVTTIPALLLNSDESLEQRKILEYSLKEREPLILENPKKILGVQKIPFAIEISSKLLPIGTSIEPISLYDQQDRSYFFENGNIGKSRRTKIKEKGSLFVTASDLYKAESFEQTQAPLLDVSFSSSEEIVEYFKNNISKWSTNFILKSRKLESIQIAKISYIIEYVDNKTMDFSSKLQLIALEEKNNTWMKVFDITILEKEFYQRIKKNILSLCSIQTLQLLVNIEV